MNIIHRLFCCAVVMFCFCFLVISFFFRSCMMCAGNLLFLALVNIIFHSCFFDCSVMGKVILFM